MFCIQILCSPLAESVRQTRDKAGLGLLFLRACRHIAQAETHELL